MVFEDYTDYILSHFLVFLIGVFIVSFIVNHLFSHKALLIAKRKRLFSEINHRSSHRIPVPAFGGISIFIVIMIMLLLVIGSGFDNAVGFTLASCFILFLTGIKDDLIGTSARTKFIVQLIAALFFVVNPEFALGHLSGFLGIELINPNWTYLIGVGFIIAIVNAFNLIDGIDGLAGLTAIVGFSVFGVYFYFNEYHIYSIFCVTLVGALSSFLIFNFAAPQKKMFMGDTGALVLGFLLAIFSLRITELQPLKPFIGFFPLNAPLFILVVLIIPVLDTTRVIFIRLANGLKPWVADKSHMHHVLIDQGYTHKQASFFLVSIQIVAILLFTLFEKIGNVALHLYVVSLYLSVTGFFAFLKAKTTTKKLAVSSR